MSAHEEVTLWIVTVSEDGPPRLTSTRAVKQPSRYRLIDRNVRAFRYATFVPLDTMEERGIALTKESAFALWYVHTEADLARAEEDVTRLRALLQKAPKP